MTFSAQDSTYITSATCDPGSAGEFVTSYTNQFGCDSIVTETVTLNISHQIDLASSSCNPADTGIFVQQLTNQFGCDSIITEIISLLPVSYTHLDVYKRQVEGYDTTFKVNHFNSLTIYKFFQ